MDGFCLETFVRACQDNPHFCTTAVARRGVGSNASEGEAWRCYSTADVDFSLTAKCCVDDCGELIECQGSTKEGSLEHLSPTAALEQLLQEVQGGTCLIYVRHTPDAPEYNPQVMIEVLSWQAFLHFGVYKPALKLVPTIYLGAPQVARGE